MTHDTGTYERTHIDARALSYGHQQIIFQRTHIHPNSSSGIDLIFINQPNLVVDHGAHPALHPNCHYQIIHCKLKLKQ